MTFEERIDKLVSEHITRVLEKRLQDRIDAVQEKEEAPNAHAGENFGGCMVDSADDGSTIVLDEGC